MDPHTLETFRRQLLALQQQLTQRIFDMEDTMLAMDADRDIERTDRVQEEGVPLSWCRAEAEKAARNPSADAVAGGQPRWCSPPLTSRGGGRWRRSRWRWPGSRLAPMGSARPAARRSVRRV